MRLDIFIIVNSTKEAIQFYVDELNLFELKHDYGMGDVVIQSKLNPDFCLSISEAEAQISKTPLFGIEVVDCKELHAELLKIKFKNGGLVIDKNTEDTIMDSPLGQNIMLKDPSGNTFVFFTETII